MTAFKNVGTITLSVNKYTDASWDFANYNTKYLTHGVHTYPAMMIPQVANRLIANYGQNLKIGYDPFCGSGSVLLEFGLAQKQSFGTDINPLALLVSKVKTTNISCEQLQKTYSCIKAETTKLYQTKNVETPNFFNIEFWFKKQVIKDLALIKQAINNIQNEEQKDFFKVCLSQAIRKCSNTRGGEFKLYRINPEKLALHEPNTMEIFDKIVKKNIESMKNLNQHTSNQALQKPKLFETNICNKIPIDERSIDLIVSSPPYGDSRTTVAYGQFSRLSLQWLDFNENTIKNLDKVGLGGFPAKEILYSNSKILDKTISSISKIDEKRAQDVIAFFNDFYKASENVEKTMKRNSTICWVVGNRTVKENIVPTDEIIVDFFKDFGYTHEKTIIRSIPSKRMPKQNCPTNIAGKISSTMNNEYIVILRR